MWQIYSKYLKLNNYNLVVALSHRISDWPQRTLIFLVIKPVKKNTNKQQKTIVQQTTNVQLDIVLSTIIKDTILFGLFLQHTCFNSFHFILSFYRKPCRQCSTWYCLSTIMKDTILFGLFLQHTFVHVLIHFISFYLSTESQISTN